MVALVAMLLASATLPPAAAHAQAPPPVPGECGVGALPGGSLGLICIPAVGWNGDLIVWAHGYRAFNETLAFQNLELSDGTNLATLSQSLGYAFAATTYRQNGLAVLEGLDDVRELVQAFRIVAGRAPTRTYMTGASEGGIVTTLLAERSTDVFSGGLALCGPIGNFRWQINYIGDFRVLFDYFFPGVLPGNALRIPAELIRNWESVYVPRVEAAVEAHPLAALELIATSKAAIDWQRGDSVVNTVLNVLWYSTFSTNDAADKLGGNPYGNLLRLYTGSADDTRLNASVLRTPINPVTLPNIARYQTSGRVTIPLVTMHTTGDEIIPFWHQVLYQQKARPAGRGRLTPIAIERYGHCEFTSLEVLAAFGLLVEQVTGSQPAGVTQRLDPARVRRDFERATRDAAPKLPRDRE